MEIIYTQPLLNALSLWSRAVKRKEPAASFQLALLYFKSRSPEQRKKAVLLLRQAAKGGAAEAKYALGVCYEQGYGVRKSGKQAVRWYKAAERQVCDDLFRLPDPAADRVNAMLQNPEQAAAMEEFLHQETRELSVEELRVLAHQGDTKSQNELGHRYAYGRGVAQNWKLAVFWSRRAALQGCEASMHRLAEYFAEIGENWKAAQWYRNYAETQLQLLYQRRRQAQER